MFPAVGQVTAIANAVATAASTALPPFFMISTPTSDAILEEDVTMPFNAPDRVAAGPGIGGNCAEDGQIAVTSVATKLRIPICFTM